MNGMGKQVAFYRGYLPDDRSLIPLTIVLATVVTLWLLVYLVAAAAEAHQDARAGRAASVTFIRNRPAASSPIRRDASAQVGHFNHRMGDVVTRLSGQQFAVISAVPQHKRLIETGARKPNIIQALICVIVIHYPYLYHSLQFPFELAQRRQKRRECIARGEIGLSCKELQLAGVEGGHEFFEEETAEWPRENAYGQKEAGPAGDPPLTVQREAAPRGDHVNMRMMRQR